MSNSPIDTLQVDIEPYTGAVWRQSLKHQRYTGVLPEYTQLMTSSNNTRPIRIAEAPIPIYWLDKSSYYNENGKDDFHDRVMMQNQH